MMNEICLMIMFLHLFIFGESGIVNGTENNISTEGRISFIQNMSLSFDTFGVLILLLNFGNLAIDIGKQIMNIYEEYQLKREKEESERIIK